MKTKEPTYNRRRLEILNYIIRNSTITYYGDNTYSSIFNNTNKNVFIPNFTHNRKEMNEGDLVALESVIQTNKYYLSFYRGKRNEELGLFGTEFLLESIEDGSLCWWSNVSFRIYQYDKNNHKKWLWNDNQYLFDDKISKASSNFWRKITPEFNDYNVTVGKRKIFEDHDPKDVIHFDDYRKVTLKQLKEFFK